MVVARRRRRIGRVAAVLGVALLVAFLVLSVRAAKPSQQTLRQQVVTFVGLSYPLVQESNASGATVAAIRLRPAQIGLVALRNDLDSLVSQTAATERSVADLSVPDDMRSGASHLLDAMKSRASAAVRLRAGMLAALGGGSASAAGSDVSSAGFEMVLADRSYQSFRSGIPKYAGGPRSVPISRWIDVPSYWGPGPVSDFVQAVGSAQPLGPVHDLLLEVVSLRPTPISVQPQLVIPATSSLQVTLVVSDIGNQPEHGVGVQAVLSAFGKPPSRLKSSVDLDPGQSRSVPMGTFSVTPGTGYLLTSTVGPVPNEVDTQNNHLTMGVQIGQ